MTDSKLVERLKRYEELAELSSLPVHPDMPGYTTGQLLQDAREAAAALEAAEGALRGMISLCAALQKQGVPKSIMRDEEEFARSAYALIKGGE